MTNIYSEENVPQSNWMKFNVVWDSVNWTFKEKFEKEGTDDLPNQVVFVLANATLDKVECDEKGDVIKIISSEKVDWEVNVGIKESNTFITSRMKNVQPWDKIGFAFTKEIPASKKGFNPAKSIKPFKFGVDEEFIKNLKYPSDTEGEISIEDVPFSL